MRTRRELLIIVRDELEKQGRIDTGLCNFTRLLKINWLINDEERSVLTTFFILNSNKSYGGIIYLAEPGDYEFRLNWLNKHIEIIE